jgi:hypothetical protein
MMRCLVKAPPGGEELGTQYLERRGAAEGQPSKGSAGQVDLVERKQD